MAPRGSFLSYVKAAFLWHWNLLAVGAGVILAVFSGRPDVVLPLAAAGEIAFLGLLSTHPKFRSAIDAQNLPTPPQANLDEELKKITAVLPKTDLKRFESLRDHCAVLNRISRQFRGLEAEGPGQLSEMQIESLNRLLWMFLKLLYSKNALDRFMGTVSRPVLAQEIEETSKDLDKARQEGRSESLIKSLADKLTTMQQRLTNYDQAAEKRELLDVELERIEQKVAAISEMSISTGDPASIGAQVDGIAESISATTKALGELDLAPPLRTETAPIFLKE